MINEEIIFQHSNSSTHTAATAATFHSCLQSKHTTFACPFFASSTSEKFQSSVKWEKNRIYEMLTYARQTTHLNTQTSEKNLFKSQKKQKKNHSCKSHHHHFIIFQG